MIMRYNFTFADDGKWPAEAFAVFINRKIVCPIVFKNT